MESVYLIIVTFLFYGQVSSLDCFLLILTVHSKKSSFLIFIEKIFFRADETSLPVVLVERRANMENSDTD